MSASWLISLVVAVVAACAGLAILGFRGRVSIVGIDLGTTFSVVGVVKDGKVTIIDDGRGNQIFPSMVSYQNNGEILVAYEALAAQSKLPHNTIYNAKRFIGKSLDDPETQAYAAEHPFHVVPTTLSNYSKVGFAVNSTGHPSVITPEQVGIQVLKHLLKLTADFLGHSQVNKAVIAVPAKFDANQREATGYMYKQAGLKVMRIVEEPTAAAVAYRLHKKDNVHHILVYDFGGGTLDVSLLYVSQGSVQVYATDGDETLGGSDLDLCLFKQLKHRLEEHVAAGDGHSSTEGQSSIQAGEVAEENICNSNSFLLQQAEQIKKALTYQQHVPFRCFMPERRQWMELVMDRQRDFESACHELFDRSIQPVKRLLLDLEMDKGDIDEIVLVGGSTRVPRIKEMLREYFQKELNDHIDPDITVAYGAASIID